MKDSVSNTQSKDWKDVSVVGNIYLDLAEGPRSVSSIHTEQLAATGILGGLGTSDHLRCLHSRECANMIEAE